MCPVSTSTSIKLINVDAEHETTQDEWIKQANTKIDETSRQKEETQCDDNLLDISFLWVKNNTSTQGIIIAV